MSLAAQLDRAIRQAGVAIIGVSIGDEDDKRTWLVFPFSLQAAAQSIIDAFDPADPAHAAADLAEMAQGDSRRKDIVATIAWVIRFKDPAAWAALTLAEKVATVRAQADIWKTIREFLDDKAV